MSTGTGPLRTLRTWPDIHEAAAHHPFVLAFGSLADLPHGYAIDGAVSWVTARPKGKHLQVHGAAESAAKLVQALHAEGVLAKVRRANVPRDAFDLIPKTLGLSREADWDFLWTTRPPPHQPGEDQVRRLEATDHDEINDVLDAALPDSISRPGHPGTRAWHGIRRDGRLVACAADISRGVARALAGIAVRPEAQGRGLGAALTARLARDLLPEHGVVALGVYRDNLGAISLYTRLGFRSRLGRTSCGVSAG